MGGRIYDPAQRRFLTPDPLVSDPYIDQAMRPGKAGPEGLGDAMNS
jgi:hypothetical protein